MRLERRSPFFPHSPWFSLAYNGAQEADIRTGGNPLSVIDGAAATGMRLELPRPNPFRGRASIAFVLPSAAPVRLAVYDAQGRRVSTLRDGVESAGTHTVAWDGRRDDGAAAPASLYFVRLEVNGEVQSRKLTLVR